MNTGAFVFKVKQLGMLEPEDGDKKTLRNVETSHPSTQRRTSKKPEFSATRISQNTLSTAISQFSLQVG